MTSDVGDLGFVEGDIIEVLNTGDGNWWTGKLKRNKVVGSFPCNFVEFLEQKASSDIPVPAAQKDGEKSNGASPAGSIRTHSNRASRDPSPNPSLDNRRSRSDFLSDVANELSQREGGTSRNQTPQPAHPPVEDEYEEENAPPPPVPPAHSSRPATPQHYQQQPPAVPRHHQPPIPPAHSPAPSFEYDDEHYYEDDRYYEDDCDSEFDQAPPPVPPPHSVSRGGGGGPRTPTNNGNSPNLDRTPSPLRNAMDDLMESLDQLDDTTRSNNTSVTAVDDYEYGTHHRHNSSNTLMTNSFYDDGQKPPPAPPKHGGGGSFSSRSASPQKIAPMTQTNAREDEDNESYDSKYIPFDPNSYNSIYGNSTNGSDSISRQNTFSSGIGGLNNSTNSNESATSAASLNRRKQNSFYRPDYEPRSSISQLSENAVISEVPVQLPNAKPSADNKSLKLKRSAGFLKKLFSSSDKSEQNQLPGFGNNMIEGHSLKRSKSRSSKKSLGSSSFKNRLSKASSKSLGKSFLGDLYGSEKPVADNTWIEVRRDVHRANSITDNERLQRRQKRELEGHMILEPMEILSKIEGDETIDGRGTWSEGRLDPRDQDFSHVDSTIFAMNSWPRMMSPDAFASSRIGRQFEYDLDRLRAIFDFCASKIAWEQDYHEDDEEDRMDPDYISASLSRLMQTRRATPRELALCFKVMCDALDIPCDVVTGHLKIPGEIWERPGITPPVNHYWNAIIINDEWKIMDASLASSSFPTRDSYYKLEQGVSVNHFYFMAPPHEMIYTHVPSMDCDQHIVPQMDPQDVMALPVVGPVAFEHSMKLLDYHSGTTRLNNYEIAELNISVPHGVDMIAEVQPGNPSNGTFDDTEPAIPALAQPYWQDNKRFIRVKAFLPDPITQGVLNIYLGDKGTLQSPNRAGLPMCYSVGITHQGQNAPFEFTTRHPTPHCQRQDIYVTQPQVKKLVTDNTYIFSVKQHPAKGITAGSGFARTKLAIQSPSGKITKLYRKGGSEDSVVFGTWENSIKCTELGTWRGLILADRGNAWSVFAEWYCI